MACVWGNEYTGGNGRVTVLRGRYADQGDLFELLARLVDLPLLEDVELGSSAKGPSVHAVAGSFPDDGVVSPEALV